MKIEMVKRMEIAKDIQTLRDLEQVYNDAVLQADESLASFTAERLLFAYRYLSDKVMNLLVMSDEPK